MRLIHQVQSGQQTQVGMAAVPLNKIMSAEIKETPENQCRVYEDWVDIKDEKNRLQGNLRILIFLEDNGPAKMTAKTTSL